MLESKHQRIVEALSRQEPVIKQSSVLGIVLKDVFVSNLEVVAQGRVDPRELSEIAFLFRRARQGLVLVDAQHLFFCVHFKIPLEDVVALKHFQRLDSLDTVADDNAMLGEFFIAC